MAANHSPALKRVLAVHAEPSPSRGFPEAAAREGAMEGVLVASGELGYRQASVRAILDYSGGHRVQFYKDFASKDDCFARAYETWIERLGVSLLEAAVGVEGWAAGVEAALAALFAFVAERPAIARALFVEVQVAGGPALAKREESMDRLATALDSVRGGIPAEQQPPETTGMFVVGAVEACVCETVTVGDPGRIWDALPELMRLVVGSYLGKEAGEAASERALGTINAQGNPGDREER